MQQARHEDSKRAGLYQSGSEFPDRRMLVQAVRWNSDVSTRTKETAAV